ncbi:MAG: universal stress protein [Hyphomonadaceae bacterium]|nr:universal stress protein [Hyphomonadaceae bacterium]
MTYRNILVQIDNSTSARARVAAAISLALRFKCAVTGVFLKSEFVPNYIVGEGMVLPSENVEAFIEERREETNKAMLAARRVFDEAARGACIPFHWLDINGDSPADLIDCARRHDLAILPPEMKAVFSQTVITAAEIGMASGGPVLVLKHGGYPAEFGRKILVAWKDSRESARALRDAWPFLAQAEEIHFLAVSPHGEAELDHLLQRHLHVHGCKEARLVVDRNDEAPVADLIRRQVGIVGADLVVLGLYGHSRLREMVLGGVSRDLLRDIPMPLLVSH